jgi:hypothetical protein
MGWRTNEKYELTHEAERRAWLQSLSGRERLWLHCQQFWPLGVALVVALALGVGLPLSR